MNRAAQQTWGAWSSVLGVLTCGRAMPVLGSFPLAGHWLWIGLEGGDSCVRRRKKLRQVQLALLELYGRRGRCNLGLARAEAQVQTHRRAGRPEARPADDFIAALEAERGRIARDLHDNAGQSLYGILLNLELVERHLGLAQTEVLARLNLSKELAAQALEQIRRVSHEMHPPDWNEMDFAAAAEWLVNSMGLRDKLQVEMGEMRPPKDLPLAVKTMLYRTLQEGLTNIARHSGARRVAIRTVVSANTIGLELEDDGKGFHVGDPGGGIGLASISQRVESLRGRFELTSAPGAGTRLSVLLPIAL